MTGDKVTVPYYDQFVKPLWVQLVSDVDYRYSDYRSYHREDIELGNESQIVIHAHYREGVDF